MACFIKPAHKPCSPRTWPCRRQQQLHWQLASSTPCCEHTVLGVSFPCRWRLPRFCVERPHADPFSQTLQLCCCVVVTLPTSSRFCMLSTTRVGGCSLHSVRVHSHNAHLECASPHIPTSIVPSHINQGRLASSAHQHWLCGAATWSHCPVHVAMLLFVWQVSPRFEFLTRCTSASTSTRVSVSCGAWHPSDRASGSIASRFSTSGACRPGSKAECCVDSSLKGVSFALHRPCVFVSRCAPRRPGGGVPAVPRAMCWLIASRLLMAHTRLTGLVTCS